MSPPHTDAPAARKPKPSEPLKDDARAFLAELIEAGQTARVVGHAQQGESTIRRFAKGDTGARASSRMLALAIVVAFVEWRRDTKVPLTIDECERLYEISRLATPGGVGLHMPELSPPYPLREARPNARGPRHAHRT